MAKARCVVKRTTYYQVLVEQGGTDGSTIVSTFRDMSSEDAEAYRINEVIDGTPSPDIFTLMGPVCTLPSGNTETVDFTTAISDTTFN